MKFNRRYYTKKPLHIITRDENIISKVTCSHCKTNDRMVVLSFLDNESVISCQICGKIDTYSVSI